MTRINRRGVLKSAVAVLAASGGATVSIAKDPRNSAAQKGESMTEPDGPTISTFLMFTGQAEEAMNVYTELFEDSEIVSISRYGAEGPGKEGTVYHATFKLAGSTLMCIDSPGEHAFTFTPAVSLYVSSAEEEKIDRYFGKLSKEGKVLMPMGEYPFSKKYAWVQDRFGVSWQLSLA